MERLVAAQNAHDVDAFVACFAPDYRSEQPLHPDRRFTGSDQVRKNWTAIFAGVPDFSATLVDVANAGDAVWGEVEWRGTKRDGTNALQRGVIIATVRDGQIAAARLYVEPVQEGGKGIDAAVRVGVGDR
jgi:ketosteroid isomerase-like protein